MPIPTHRPQRTPARALAAGVVDLVRSGECRRLDQRVEVLGGFQRCRVLALLLRGGVGDDEGGQVLGEEEARARAVGQVATHAAVHLLQLVRNRRELRYV